MADKPAHYLREWRNLARMTQDQLADAIGTSKSTISDFETFKLQLSPKWTARLAPVLRTSQGNLIDFHPRDLPPAPPPEVSRLWRRISEKDQPRALKVLESFAEAEEPDEQDREGTND